MSKSRLNKIALLLTMVLFVVASCSCTGAQTNAEKGTQKKQNAVGSLLVIGAVYLGYRIYKGRFTGYAKVKRFHKKAGLKRWFRDFDNLLASENTSVDYELVLSMERRDRRGDNELILPEAEFLEKLADLNKVCALPETKALFDIDYDKARKEAGQYRRHIVAITVAEYCRLASHRERLYDALLRRFALGCGREVDGWWPRNKVWRGFPDETYVRLFDDGAFRKALVCHGEKYAVLRQQMKQRGIILTKAERAASWAELKKTRKAVARHCAANRAGKLRAGKGPAYGVKQACGGALQCGYHTGGDGRWRVTRDKMSRAILKRELWGWRIYRPRGMPSWFCVSQNWELIERYMGGGKYARGIVLKKEQGELVGCR